MSPQELQEGTQYTLRSGVGPIVVRYLGPVPTMPRWARVTHPLVSRVVWVRMAQLSPLLRVAA